ncbi:MAG: thiol reductant ABC exporter subunit CydD [Ardenticatenaceae bacterium]|nr:thiol reductant ABC exporter subunit CydD [Ardenticatenaceae bacterium]
MFNRPLWHEAVKSRLTLSLTILFSVLGGGATILQAYWLSRIVNQVFLQGAALVDVQRSLWALLLLLIARALFSGGREVTANQIAATIKEDLRNRLFAHVQALGPVQAAGERAGELTAVLTTHIDALETYFSQYLPQLFVAALIPLAILIAIFPTDWLSGLVLLLTAPLIPLFMVLIGRYAETLTKRQWQLLSRMSAHFLDVLQGLTTLKLLGQSKRQAANIAAITGRFRDATLSVLRVAFLSALVLELLSTLSVAIIAVAIGLRLLHGGIPFQQALFILILAPEFYLPLRMLGQRFHAGMDGTAAAKQIFGLLSKTSQWSIANSQLPIANRQSSIRFDDVHVAYQHGDRPALHGVSFTIEPGETVALIGPSGAGKSTIASLLLGFIQPISGKIEIGDSKSSTDNRLLNTDYRLPTAWVPQRPFLFHDTLANNIRLGNPTAPDTAVVAAAQQARIHDFITSLPDGYETQIGERGTRLSGGQAQRVALARAFLMDAPFIILDEPTAHLDADMVAELLAATADLLHGRTALIIAHNPQTLALADKVVTLENGRVTQLTIANRQPTTSNQQPATNNPSFTVHHSPFTIHYSPPPLPRLLSFLRPYPGWVALAVLLGALTIGSSIGLLGTSAYLISAAALQPSIAALNVAIVGVRFFGLSRGIFRYLERLVSHNLTFRLLARLRVWFYEAIEPLAPARLQQRHSGDLLGRIVGDIETLQEFYVRVVGPSLVAAVITLGMTLIMGQYAPRLALALLLLFVSSGVALPVFVYASSRHDGQLLIATRNKLQEQLIDGIQGMADLCAYGQAQRMAKTVATSAAKLAHVQRRFAWIHGLHAALGEFLAQFGVWTAVTLAIPLVSSGQINGVYLAGLALMTLAAFEAVQPLPLAAQQLGSSLAAARRLFEIVDAGKVAMVNTQLSLINREQQPHLSIQNLTFTYQPSLPPVLKNITLDLPPGEKVALVGPSGAGKSTLVNLLLRFWEFEEGRITLNGRDIRTLDPDNVRQQFSVIAQDTYLFNSTIWDNLRLARPSASRAEIEAAAQAADIHDFISQLPQGYDTQVGEQGMQLSGGQRQRIAIARALLHNAPILILDEPTANLDSETERRVLDTIFALAAGRTLLLITHRSAGLDKVDKIVTLRRGKIVAQQHITDSSQRPRPS